MRHLLAMVLLALLPLTAMAQWAPVQLPAAQTHSYGVLALTPANGDSAVVVPLWQSADGRLLALVADSRRGPTPRAGSGLGWDLRLIDASAVISTGVRWDISPHFYTRAGVKHGSVLRPMVRDCDASMVSGTPSGCAAGAIPAWLGGEVGGGFRADNFDVDIGVNWLDRGAVVNTPLAGTNVGMAPALYGIPGDFIDSLNGVGARGSLWLGDGDTRFSVGASIGRLQLLPGSLVGLDAIDKKALSFGVGLGAVSGVVVGRVMQPVPGLYGAGSPLEQPWNAIDLGITWHLPWQGELRVGAQNLWSSGQTSAASNVPLDPAQRRMPYIQYHQDL